MPGDQIAVVGEECHIVARAGGGPRAGEISESELDRYENLILLCGADHTLVDAQTQLYTSTRLREINADHEAWVQRCLTSGALPERFVDETVERDLAASNAPRPRLAFTGREDEIRAIGHFLREGKPVAVQGLGGIGKTRLVAEYSFRSSAEYDVVWWVRAEDDIALTTDLAALARALRLVPAETRDVDEELAAAYAWLYANDRWLLVFDDARGPEEISKRLPSSGRGAIVITSRYGADWQGLAHPLALGVWPRHESVAFLRTRIASAGGEDHLAKCEQLAETLGDLPLALEQAAAYVAATCITISDYLRRLSEHRPQLLAAGKPIDYREPVATTWELSFREVIQELPAQVVLLVCAFCSSDRIPRWVFDSDGPLGSLVAELNDALKVDSAVARLMTFSLVDAEPGWLTVHRLVQEVARERLQHGEAVSFYSLAEQLLLRTFPAEPRRAGETSRARALVPHVMAAAAHASELATESEATAAMLNAAGSFLCWQLDLERAEGLLTSALRIKEAVNGDVRLTIAIHIELSRVFSERGDFPEAEAEMRLAIGLFNARAKEPRSALPLLVSDLAVIQRRAGRPHEAVATAREALRLAERVEGAEPQNQIPVLIALANALEDGEEALHHLQRALGIAQSADPPDEHTLAVIRSNLANRRGSSGDLQRGLVDAQESLAAAETAYGPDHPRIADMLINAANVFRDCGQLQEAREAARRAVRIEEKAQSESRRRALSLMTLAQIEQRLADHAAAIETIDRAYALAEAMAAGSSISIKVLSVRGDIRREAGDLVGAETDLRRALEQAPTTPGVDRHTLGMTYTRLGSVRRHQGRPDEAAQLHQQAVALLRSDDSQPAALMDALNNLGNALDDCRDFAGAIVALERARAIGIRIFGRQHERMWQLAVNLAYAYLHAGDMWAAKVVLADAQGVRPAEIELTPVEPGGEDLGDGESSSA